jgi:hypothetical protein
LRTFVPQANHADANHLEGKTPGRGREHYVTQVMHKNDELGCTIKAECGRQPHEVGESHEQNRDHRAQALHDRKKGKSFFGFSQKNRTYDE